MAGTKSNDLDFIECNFITNDGLETRERFTPKTCSTGNKKKEPFAELFFFENSRKKNQRRRLIVSPKNLSKEKESKAKQIKMIRWWLNGRISRISSIFKKGRKFPKMNRVASHSEEHISEISILKSISLYFWATALDVVVFFFCCLFYSYFLILRSHSIFKGRKFKKNPKEYISEISILKSISFCFWAAALDGCLVVLVFFFINIFIIIVIFFSFCDRILHLSLWSVRK